VLTYESCSQHVSLSHGDIHYHDVGEGPCLLLIHGSGPGVTAWANFQYNLAHFSQRFRCIALDLPGYGASDAIEGEPVATAVQACLALLDALAINKAHIIGNSLGGIVGSYIAAQNPSRVSSFTSIGGVGLNIYSAFPGEGLNLLSAFAENPTRENIETWLRSMVYDQSIITDALIDARFAQACEPKTLATTRALYSQAGLKNIAQMRRQFATKTLEHLPSIQAPTLITWGRDDRVSPLDMSLLPMRLIPNCELHIFPNCGHWSMIECKDKFEALVMSFMCLHEPSFND